MIRPLFSISALYFAFLIATILLLAEVVSYITLYNNLIVELMTLKICEVYLTNLEYAIGRYSLITLDNLLLKLKREKIDLNLLKRELIQKLDFDKLVKVISCSEIKASVKVLNVEVDKCSGGQHDVNELLGLPVNVPSESLDLKLDLVILVFHLNNDTGIKRRVKLIINHPMRLFSLLKVKKRLLLLNSTSYVIKNGVENVTKTIMKIIECKILECLDHDVSLSCSGIIVPKKSENSLTLLYDVRIYKIEIRDDLQNTILKAREIIVSDRISLKFIYKLNGDIENVSNQTSTFHLFLKKN